MSTNKIILLLVSFISYFSVGFLLFDKDIVLVVSLDICFVLGIYYLNKVVTYIFNGKNFEAIITKKYEPYRYGDSTNSIYYFDIEYEDKDELIEC